MSIKLNKPYKIAPLKAKRYEAHYNMPASNSLVVPLREFGDEVSCDVRWQDSNGELQLQQNKIFVSQNLLPLNPMLDTQLHELWEHYYNRE